MAAKPIKTVELSYPMSQFLIIILYFQTVLESKREALTGLLVQLVGEQQKREDELMKRLVSYLPVAPALENKILTID